MQILELLADGTTHSGEQLGKALGISRAAVWKQVASLRKKGVDIEVVPGRGYRLAQALEPWRRESIERALSTVARSLIRCLQIEQTTTSTNDVVAALMRDLPGAGAIACFAEEQTAGRGRRGREWFSPWGRNFYGSVGWTFPEGLMALEGLSLAVGVAITRALRRYGTDEVRLKWPNDLVVGGAKLGGVLIEVQAEAGGPCQAIIGIGLNLSLPTGTAELLGRAVADLASLVPGPVRKNELGAFLIDELVILLRDYPIRRFAGVRDEWMALDALRGAPVEITGLSQVLEGRAEGVDEQGALLLRTSRGLERIQAGEVSLRAQP